MNLRWAITILIGATAGLIYSQSINENLRENAAYADSLLDDRFGADKFTVRATYLDRLTSNPTLGFRLVGVKERGLMIVDITAKGLMPIVAFLPSKGKNIEDLVIRGPVVYWLENRPSAIVSIDLHDPFNPCFVGKIDLTPINIIEGKTKLKLEGNLLSVYAVREGKSRVVAVYDTGEQPYRPRLVQLGK